MALRTLARQMLVQCDLVAGAGCGRYGMLLQHRDVGLRSMCSTPVSKPAPEEAHCRPAVTAAAHKADIKPINMAATEMKTVTCPVCNTQQPQNLQLRNCQFCRTTDVENLENLQHFHKAAEMVRRKDDPGSASEPIPDGELPPIAIHAMPHPIWSEEATHSVEETHRKPVGIVDHLAYGAVYGMKTSFDVLSGFNRNERDTRIWVNRICFLETLAAVPGMVAAMVRHLQSLRIMKRDHGWIHTLLEEAENERMHLMMALQLKQPGMLFRLAVVGAQISFVTSFGIAYIISPRFCHRFVGYLEEEAVHTYTSCLKDIEDGPLKHWQTTPAPEMAIRYWQLKTDATMKDVILAVRADEAHHRGVNHTLATLKPSQFNPYKPGE